MLNRHPVLCCPVCPLGCSQSGGRRASKSTSSLLNMLRLLPLFFLFIDALALKYVPPYNLFHLYTVVVRRRRRDGSSAGASLLEVLQNSSARVL